MQRYNHVARLLLDMNMNHKIYISDLGKLLKEEEQAIALRRALYSGKAIDLENYHTYEEVNLKIYISLRTSLKKKLF